MPNKDANYDKKFREEFKQRNGISYSAFLRKRSPAEHMMAKAKWRAKKSGIPFSITADDIVIPEFCPVLGLKLEIGNTVKTASSPSLDRIKNHLGYVPGNVQVISALANTMKNCASYEELVSFARWIVRNHYSLSGEFIIMTQTLEDQVTGLVTGQAQQTVALNAIAAQLTALQTSVAAIPTTPVAAPPATTSPPDILAAVAALQTSVTAIATAQTAEVATVNAINADLQPTPVATPAPAAPAASTPAATTAPASSAPAATEAAPASTPSAS